MPAPMVPLDPPVLFLGSGVERVLKCREALSVPLLFLATVLCCAESVDQNTDVVRSGNCELTIGPRTEGGVFHEFIDRADQAYDVVEGRLVWMVVEDCSEHTTLPCTTATVKVFQSLRGAVGETIRVRSLGSYESGRTSSEDSVLPRYQDDAIIFLWDGHGTGGDPFFTIVDADRGYILRQDAPGCFGVPFDEVIAQLVAEVGGAE